MHRVGAKRWVVRLEAPRGVSLSSAAIGFVIRSECEVKRITPYLSMAACFIFVLGLLARETFRVCRQEGRDSAMGPLEGGAAGPTPVCAQAVGHVARVGTFASKFRWGTARQFVERRPHQGW